MDLPLVFFVGGPMVPANPTPADVPLRFTLTPSRNNRKQKTETRNIPSFVFPTPFRTPKP